jgi:hypothetical protein
MTNTLYQIRYRLNKENCKKILTYLPNLLAWQTFESFNEDGKIKIKKEDKELIDFFIDNFICLGIKRKRRYLVFINQCKRHGLIKKQEEIEIREYFNDYKDYTISCFTIFFNDFGYKDKEDNWFCNLIKYKRKYGLPIRLVSRDILGMDFFIIKKFILNKI